MKRHLLMLLVIVLVASMVLIVAGFKKADETTSIAASSGIELGSDGDGDSGTYIMNSDGSNIAKDTDYESGLWQAYYSQDGSKSVFALDRDGDLEIYVMNSDGSGEVRLTNNDTDDSGPVWSPDGSKIAFASGRDGNEEIYVMNSDGSSVVRLTYNDAWDWGFPTWSPDGSKIAFSSDRDGLTEIYVMNSDGSGVVRLTDNDAFNTLPDWSPDGSKIAFDSYRVGNFTSEIYVMNSDGSGVVRLTDGYWPVWSPDGSKIAFYRIIDVAPSGFRPAGPLVPEITTYIPTPLNLSPKPTVIGTNLLLAALTMLLFAVAAELFTRTLTKNEEVLKRKMRPATWLGRMKKRIEAIMGTKMGRHLIARDIAKLLGIILFYGLAFSLLDRTWKPFSLTGLVLFLNMTIAYGIVGIADDIMQWRALKKWGISTEIGIRPTNVLISVISISTSRLVGIVPGLMFGTPEALRVDESTLDKAKRNRLLKISATTFLVVGFGLWLLTIATSLIQRLSLSGTLVNFIGGFEGFLLIIFAVALENTFIQMLGFPGGFGRALKQKNRWLWFGGLVGITFIFYHTLINPRGELVEALQETNVILFLSIAVAFIIIAFGLWLYFRRKWQTES
ncbi:MAG: hypothetical protein MUO96_05115 [Actinobacteria bacterium]|nr:hypothetical protein [Actinomycetota bacterium]